MKRALHFLGDAVFKTGKYMQRTGSMLKFTDPDILNPQTACRHRRWMPLEGKTPSIAQGAWIAPTAAVIGQVDIGARSTVWYGAVLRGDVHNIKIGFLSSIGDRSIVHVSSRHGGVPTVIGNEVIIEHGVILHACTIEDGAKVESGSLIADGAVVGKNAIVGAGSLVPPGKRIPSGELWAGSPAQFVRKLTIDEIEKLQQTAKDWHQLSLIHEQELSKSDKQRRAEQEHFEVRGCEMEKPKVANA